jgi:hypothetical protein
MSTPEELEAQIQAEEAQISQDITELESVESQVPDIPTDESDLAINLTKSTLFPQS